MVLEMFRSTKNKRELLSNRIVESSRAKEMPKSGRKQVLKGTRSIHDAGHSDYEMIRVSTRPKASEAITRKLIQERERCNGCFRCTCGNKESKIYENNVNASRTHLFQNKKVQNESIGTYRKVPVYSGKVSAINAQHSQAKNVPVHSQYKFDSTDNTNVVLQTTEIKYAVRKTLKPKMGKSSLPETKYMCVSRHGKDFELETDRRTPQCHNNRNAVPSSMNKHRHLAQSINSQIANMNQKEGKEAILNRYFADYIMYQSPSREIRGQGDGAESHEADNIYSRRGDGSSFTCYESIKRNDVCNISFKTNDVDSDISSDSGQEDCDFDVAFIDIDERSEDQTLVSGRLVDYSLSESDISDIECDRSIDISETNSVSTLVRNVFNDNISSGEEDDEMNSFMNSKLSDDISDEGLSSMGSDSDSL